MKSMVTVIVPPKFMERLSFASYAEIGARKVWLHYYDGSIKTTQRSKLPNILPEDWFKLVECVEGALKP